MGIDPVNQRPMMEQSLEAILALLRSDEPVTRQTDWFSLLEGRLQVRPYTQPHFEVAVAAMVSPSGPRLAGKYGVSLLSLSMSAVEGFAAIGQAWGVVEDQAEKAGLPAPDRRTWRVVGSMHLAETRQQDIEDCTYGLEDFANYFGGGPGFVPLGGVVDDQPKSPYEFVETYASNGRTIIGTPDDAIAFLEGLQQQSGGFGTFLLLGHDWASREATLNSYRLFAREVMPYFQGHLAPARTSHDWAISKRGQVFERAGAAIMNAISTHVEETAPSDGSDGSDGSDVAGEKVHQGN
jgi:limonene 1,2-monooxygenase